MPGTWAKVGRCRGVIIDRRSCFGDNESTMRRVVRGALVVSAFALFACEGRIGTPANAPGNPGNDPNDPNDPAGPAAEVPAPAPRLFRLTHAQWERSVRALLQLDETAPTHVENLRIDPNQAGFIFDNNTGALAVDSSLWTGYRRAANRLAEDVTASPAAFARLVPDSTEAEDVRARQFIESFGLRAHRRPLSTAEVDEYFAVYTTGRDLFPEQSAFEAGIRLTIDAFLQSPKFVYRFEASNAATDGVIPLDGYEVAARMSYFLWNSMPDEPLLTAAQAGELATAAQVQAQAERMLADPRAEDVVARFHDALLVVERYNSIAPSPAFFPDAPENLPVLLERENDLFIRSMFRDGHSWQDMLTTNKTFVNADTATLYGLTGNYGPEFEAVDLDPTQRRGLFTQLGFLASNATSVNPDPIHRGVFLSERIACNSIAAPPNDIPPLPPAEGRTNRETIEAHTEAPGTNCAACHTTLINPFGFPFEGFDALGQVRTEDNGQPIDSASTVYIKGDSFGVADALQLADTLANSKAVHECYAKHWVEYALGRPLVRADDGIIQVLEKLSTEGGSIRSMLARLVQSPAFLARSTEEL